jgi:tetratricopeptide (TPR) repeat protein
MRRKTEQNIENRIIATFIFSIWFVLIVFGLISINPPQWLTSISSSGKTVEALGMKGVGDNYLRDGNYKKAIIQYQGCLKIQPDMVDAIVNLGIAYAKIGNLGDAISTFNYALSRDPDMPNIVYYNIADVYEKSGNLDAAITNYQKAAETAPFAVYPYFLLGKCYLLKGDYISGKDALFKAYNNRLTMINAYEGMLKRDRFLFPESPVVFDTINAILSKGLSEYQLASYDSVAFELGLKQDKLLSEIYDKIGYVYAMSGEMDTAILYFNKALKIDPNFQNARNNLNAAIANR